MNLRFIPFAFDLSQFTIDRGDFSLGAMVDPEARDFVIRGMPELDGQSVDTPPVLVATPDGKIIARIDNYASEDEFLAALLRVLSLNSDWNHEEDIADATRRCSEERSQESFLHLVDLEVGLEKNDEALSDCMACLLRAHSDDERRAVLLRLLRLSRLCRKDRVFDACVERLRSLDPDDPDVEIQIGRHLLMERQFSRIAEELKHVPLSPPSLRASEACYMLAISRFNLGDVEAAKTDLRELIRTMPDGPWRYRADWALFSIECPGKRTFSTADPPTCLGRLGYMGRLNPDIVR